MNAQTIVQRAYVFLVLSLVATAAYFQARGLVQLLSIVLGTGAGAVRLESASRHSTPSTPPKGEASTLARNPFDSTSPWTRGTEAPAAQRRTDERDPLAWPTCDGLDLVIVSESRDAAWSLASLRRSGTTEARLVRAGELFAERRIAFVGYNPHLAAPAVWLEGASGGCQSVLFRPAQPPAPARVAPPNVDAPRPAGPALRETLRDPMKTLRSVRVVPESRAGAVVGLRLYGVRPGSLLDTLGIRNGDRLETINGFSVAGPEQALTAYARLRSASRLVVHVERQGAPVELAYRID